MAERGAAAAGGRADRVPDRAARRGCSSSPTRSRASRPRSPTRGARARHADARLHVPAGRAADDRRALAALVRLPRAARRAGARSPTSTPPTAARPAPAASTGRATRSTASGSSSLLGFGGPIEHTRDAMWQTDGFAEATWHAAQAATEREPVRRGPRDLRQRRVRAAADRRRAVPRQRADAAEAQPVRARRDPRRRAHAARPRDRRAREPADALGPDRQPAVRVRRGRGRGRAGDARCCASPPATAETLDDRPRPRRARAARERRDGDRRSRSDHARRPGLDYRSAYRRWAARWPARRRRARGAADGAGAATGGPGAARGGSLDAAAFGVDTALDPRARSRRGRSTAARPRRWTRCSPSASGRGRDGRRPPTRARRSSRRGALLRLARG